MQNIFHNIPQFCGKWHANSLLCFEGVILKHNYMEHKVTMNNFLVENQITTFPRKIMEKLYVDVIKVVVLFQPPCFWYRYINHHFNV